jgi:hypothetical protein
MKKFFLSLVFAFSLPQVAMAHIKWFVDVTAVEATYRGTEFFSWWSKPVVVWVLVTLLLIGLAKVLNQNLEEPKKVLEFGEKHQKTIYRLFKILVGIFLVVISGFWQIVLVPQIPASGVWQQVLQVAQGIIGVMLIIDVFPKWAGLALGGLYLMAGGFGGWEFYLENLLILAIALFIYLNEINETHKLFAYQPWAVPILRTGAGMSLVVLAFTEKFLHPELALQFLSEHNWNFVKLLGFNFSNQLFVLSAGFMETIFGLMFIFGYVVRINTLVMASFFATSVTTMAIQSGVWEVEDLLIYAVAIIFIFYKSHSWKLK